MRILPRHLPFPLAKHVPAAPADRMLVELSHKSNDDVLRQLETQLTGLMSDEASRRLEKHGPNTTLGEQSNGWLGLVYTAIVNPLVILLSVLAAVSYATGDVRAAIVIASMVLLGVVLRLVQEFRAGTAAAKL